jgi:hypothetical protein
LSLAPLTTLHLSHLCLYSICIPQYSLFSI